MDDVWMMWMPVGMGLWAVLAAVLVRIVMLIC